MDITANNRKVSAKSELEKRYMCIMRNMYGKTQKRNFKDIPTAITLEKKLCDFLSSTDDLNKTKLMVTSRPGESPTVIIRADAWGNNFIAPANYKTTGKNINFFTQYVRNCPLLMMRLMKNGSEYILMNHVYVHKMEEIVANTINLLGAHKFGISDLIFSPSKAFAYNDAACLLETFSLQRKANYTLIVRDGLSQARGLITDIGALIYDEYVQDSSFYHFFWK
jgi:hypothetical protein